MRFPSVVVVSPGFAALVHQVFLMLFVFFALVPRCFLVDVVRIVIIDFGKSLDCVLIAQFMILI